MEQFRLQKVDGKKEIYTKSKGILLSENKLKLSQR